MYPDLQRMVLRYRDSMIKPLTHVELDATDDVTAGFHVGMRGLIVIAIDKASNRALAVHFGEARLTLDDELWTQLCDFAKVHPHMVISVIANGWHLIPQNLREFMKKHSSQFLCNESGSLVRYKHLQGKCGGRDVNTIAAAVTRKQRKPWYTDTNRLVESSFQCTTFVVRPNDTTDKATWLIMCVRRRYGTEHMALFLDAVATHAFFNELLQPKKSKVASEVSVRLDELCEWNDAGFEIEFVMCSPHARDEESRAHAEAIMHVLYGLTTAHHEVVPPDEIACDGTVTIKFNVRTNQFVYKH